MSARLLTQGCRTAAGSLVTVRLSLANASFRRQPCEACGKITSEVPLLKLFSSCSLCLGVTGTSQYGSGAKAQRTWGRVDLLNGKATIVLSRTLGEENAPKTGASTRTIALLPNVVELLKTLLPLHVTAEDYVFTDEQGKTHRSKRVRA